MKSFVPVLLLEETGVQSRRGDAQDELQPFLHSAEKRLHAGCELRKHFIQNDLDLIMCDVTFLHPIIRMIVRMEMTSNKKNTVDQE